MSMDEDKEQLESGWLTCTVCGFSRKVNSENVNEDYYCDKPSVGLQGQTCGGLMKFTPEAPT